MYKGFIQVVTSIYQRLKLSLQLSFETQPYKPKNRKSNKDCLDCLERLLFFLTFRSHDQCKKSVQKEKSQSRERNACMW